MAHRRLPSLLLSAAALALAGAARAGDDPSLKAFIEPGRNHWVASPVELAVTLAHLTPEIARNADPAAFRVRLNGVDVTAAFLGAVAARGRAHLDPGTWDLRLAVPVELPPGTWDVEVVLGYRWGARETFRQSFTVYDPDRVLRELGWIPPAPVDGTPGPRRRIDQDFPSVVLTPADQDFVRTATPAVRVRWSDVGSGVDPAHVRVLLDNQPVTVFDARGPDFVEFTPPPLAGGMRTVVAQVTDRAGNLTVRTSTFLVFARPRYPWFYQPTNQPHPLAHTHHQYQLYSSSASQAYFHHGVDIRRPRGTRVHASAPGRVTALLYYSSQPLYYRVEVTDQDGYRWQYHHVDETTVPAAIHAALSTSAPIASGTDIGAVVPWPVQAYGQYFDHIHLNVIAPDGRYVNPLNFLLPVEDTLPPRVMAVYLLPNAGTDTLNGAGASGAVISGDIDIVARAEDLADGEPYQLTLKKLSWEVEELTGTRSHHVPETPLWDFNFLPGGADRSLHVHTIFKRTFRAGSTTLTTRGNYNSRVFYYVLTNRRGPVPDELGGFWPTGGRDVFGRRLFPDGDYRITVRAYDEAGNSGSRSITATVRN